MMAVQYETKATNVGGRKGHVHTDDNAINVDVLPPQQRACDTLENAVTNQQYWCVKDLKEWGFGLFEGESIELLRAIKQPRYLYGDAVVPFGGESRSEVEHRVYRALYEMMDTTDGETILAVSHGSTIGLFVRNILGYDKGSKFEIGNCNIVKFEYDGEEFIFKDLINPIKK